MTELLKITHVKDDICEVSASLLDEEMTETLAAALLGAMCNDDNLASAVIAAASAFSSDDNPDIRSAAARSTLHLPGTDAMSS